MGFTLKVHLRKVIDGKKVYEIKDETSPSELDYKVLMRKIVKGQGFYPETSTAIWIPYNQINYMEVVQNQEISEPEASEDFYLIKAWKNTTGLYRCAFAEMKKLKGFGEHIGLWNPLVSSFGQYKLYSVTSFSENERHALEQIWDSFVVLYGEN